MKYLLIIFIGLVLFTSCNSSNGESSTEPVKAEETKSDPTQQELNKNTQNLIAKILDVSELKLELNGEDKWVVSEEIFTKLMKIKHQIYVISGNMENYTLESYNEMGSEFFEYVNAIPQAENPDANMELQKVISSTKIQISLLTESNLQSAQIAVINMSNIYHVVPDFFNPSK